MQCPIWKPGVVNIVLVLLSCLFAVESAVQNQMLQKAASTTRQQSVRHQQIVKLETFDSQANTANTAEMERQEFLDAHNKVRAQHGEPPYTWDPKLELFAKQYFEKEHYNDCNMVHSRGPYGENLMNGPGPSHMYNASLAVKLWADEINYYNRTSNTCQPGKMCGHYTQIVWRDSVRVGCFRGICKNGNTYVVCEYEPRGNYIGQNPFDDHGRRDWFSPPENQTSQPNVSPPAENQTSQDWFSPPENQTSHPNVSPPAENQTSQDWFSPPENQTSQPNVPPPAENQPSQDWFSPPENQTSQPNVTVLPEMDKQEFLNGHNKIRSLHGLPPYTWDPKLQLFAKQHCDQHYNDCNLVYSGGPYGESIMKASAGYFGTASDAVKELANIDENYYEQIVSRDSIRLGCHHGKCKSGESCIICEYEPPGN